MNYHSSDPLLLHLFVQPGRVPVLHELAERAPGRGGGVPFIDPAGARSRRRALAAAAGRRAVLDGVRGYVLAAISKNSTEV